MSNKTKVVLSIIAIVAVWSLVALAASACSTDKEPTPNTTPIVVVTEGDTVANLAPPTRLDIIMQPTGNPKLRCADAGGTFKELNGRLLCEDVDY